MTRKDLPYEGCMLPAGSVIEVEISENGMDGHFRFGTRPGDVICFTDIRESLFMFNDYIEEMKLAVTLSRPDLALSVGIKMLGRVKYQCPEILERPPVAEKFESPPYVSDMEARLENVE
jgi:hypothetical protein